MNAAVASRHNKTLSEAMPAKKKTLKTFTAPSRDHWRNWLARHHAAKTEIWLIFFKPPAQRASVNYEDAVDEALCFGWIDSLIRRIDDLRYARKFTPRKADSKWSDSNRRRYAELQAQGLLTAAGQKRSPTERSYNAPPRADAVPEYIRRALKEHAAAGNYFAELAPSYRRAYVKWIDSAKQTETKLRRLREAVELLGAGRKLGMK